MRTIARRPAPASRRSVRQLLSTLAVLALGLTALQAVVAAPHAEGAPVGFGKSTLSGPTLDRATSLQFGPDGRLYVLHQDGTLRIYGVERQAANDYAVTSTSTVPAIKNIANHDDNGTLNNNVVAMACVSPCRQATGMVVTGTAASPVVYVSSSDPRYGGGPRGDLNLDTNSGMVSRLTWNAGTATWVKKDLVRGLPRSEENHAVNGMTLDKAANVLYLAVGGHTNQGAPSKVFAELPEFALSAAVLSIDLDAIGNTTYDLPTLDDPKRPNSSPGVDVNDPFGGNDGANQAKIVPGGPVQVHSPGYRNAYDLLIATVGSRAGKMYVTDNGYNAGQGGPPVGQGTPGCTNGINNSSPITGYDSLHHVTGPGYYGGHPNPTRGNNANTFGGQTPVPASEENPVECDFQNSLEAADPTPERDAIGWDVSSTNGIAEYTASNFGGAMKGDLVAAAWDGYVLRFTLNSAGTAVTGKSKLFSAVSTHPLDLTAVGDAGPFPGTIWLADHTSGSILVFEPNDFGGGGGGTCAGTDSATLDEDGDGYTNADEIDNGTNPCSAGDKPRDWDGDGVSNLNDPNDDNDAAPDTSDPWAVDGANGTTTKLPVHHPFDDTSDGGAGYLLNLGFTGLMTNGSTNYEKLYDPTKLTAGGAPGVLTVDQVGPGDATGTKNSQAYAFQYGFQVSSARGSVFTPHTRVLTPFAGTTPQGTESIGMHFGTGDQNNYVKLFVSGAGAVRLVKEVNGAVVATRSVAVPLSAMDMVDLFLAVDPQSGTVQPSYQVTDGATTQPRTNLGAALAVPKAWFSRAALATGVIASSGGAPAFPATWDMFEIQYPSHRPDARVRLSTVTAFTGNNVYNATAAQQTVGVTTAPSTTRTFVVDVQNDGSASNSYVLRGPGSSPGFTVKYFAGTTDITAAVVNGTHSLNGVPPGGTRAIQMRVTTTSTVPSGSVRSSVVTATSANTGTAVDAIETVVTVG